MIPTLAAVSKSNQESSCWDHLLPFETGATGTNESTCCDSDREAQRAIRERTKNQIDALERRVEQLTSLKPYEELQVAIRTREAVERENADIKRRLASIMTMLQSIVGSTGTFLARRVARNPFPPSPSLSAILMHPQ